MILEGMAVIVLILATVVITWLSLRKSDEQQRPPQPPMIPKDQAIKQDASEEWTRVTEWLENRDGTNRSDAKRGKSFQIFRR
jgi:hypothetical protein